MKKIAVIILLSIIFFNLFGEVIQLEVFTKAVTDYKNREFEKALEKFIKIENQGINNAELFVNIGNCYFRLDELGMAILYYKKALKIDPKDEKAIRNYKYSTSLSIDAQQKETEDFFSKMLKLFYNSLSVKSLAYISLLFFLLMVAFINLLIFHYRSKEKTLQYFILIIFAIFFISTFLLGIEKWNKLQNSEQAVLIADSAIGFSGPGDDFTRVFTIHEGNVFKIIRTQDSWTLVQLNSGLGGWINNNFFQTIQLN